MDNATNSPTIRSPHGLTSNDTSSVITVDSIANTTNQVFSDWVVNFADALKGNTTLTFPNDNQVEEANTYWISNAFNPSTPGLSTDGTLVNNSSTPGVDNEMPHWATILALLMMIVTCLLIIVGNVIVLIVFHYTPSLNNASGIFIKSLACADLGVGICCSFSIHSWFLQEWPYGDASCAITGYTLAVAVGVSIIGLACLSIDRYIAITRPLKYFTILTKTRARIIVIAVWLISAGIFLPSMFGWGTFHYNDHSYECSLHWEENVAFSFFIIAVLVVPALVISTFCYVHILKVSFVQTQQIERTGMMFKSPNQRESTRSSYERLLAKIFLVIISAFYVTWLPFVVTKTLRGLVDIHIPPAAMFFFSWLGIVNSFLNCIVYSIGHQSFRDGFVVMIRKSRRRASTYSSCFFTSNSRKKHHKKLKKKNGHLYSNGKERFIDVRPIPIPIKESSL
ncbi:probable G-protein coupled receptor 21 [Lytechinus variegatus]|uniref:probable G-protein coupled receptor 21 n=1 Tax=Lytechinus variegatus TaxID=7654 RepID=UPI001BB187D8|nr:probable G-protein coupled receptor 21 [Lytechinus variegatus]